MVCLMRITAENVGLRMVVRYVVPGRGPSGGPAMTDVVGRILTLDDDLVTVERRDGTVSTIELARVVTAKVVPPTPTRSRGAMAISADNLKDIMARGWAAPTDLPEGVLVQVAMLRNAYGTAGVRIDEHASEEWVARYEAAGGRAPLDGPATVGFLSIGEPIVAIGRIVVTGEWAGLSGMQVAADSRRQGLGTRIVEAGISWARQHGADKAYVRVHQDNEAALAMLAPFGFRTHPM